MKQTPEEKATSLLGKYQKLFFDANASEWTEPAKRAAIIAVDEILSITPMYKGELNPDYTYWQSVKSHLQK